jgi:hypothetical protein
MMFRCIALAGAMSLFPAAVSTTAHAGEDAGAGSGVAAAPETPPGAVFAPPSAHRTREIGPQPVARELLVGAGVGAGVTLGAGAIAFLALQDGERDQADNAAGALAIGLIAYPLGAALGVAGAGTDGHVYGGVKNTIAGAYLGAISGAVLCGLVGLGIAPEEGAGASVGVLLGYVVGAPLGAAIIWNATLQDHGPSTGLINVSGSRTRLSIPMVSVTPDPLRAQGTLASIRLMDGRF